MNQQFSLSASRLLVECTNTLSPQLEKSILTTKTNNTNKNKENDQNNKKISPQEQNENNKIIQKLRKKAKKKTKQIFIRKTDLGEGQFVFTPEELQKLKLIDQFQAMGLKYQDIQKQQELNAQKIRKLSIPQDYIDEIKKYMQWIDVSQLKKINHQTRHKHLNFQKRSFHKKENGLDYRAAQKKKTFIKQNQANQKHSIPMIKKLSTQNKFLSSYTLNSGKLPKCKSRKEIINEVFDKANMKIKKQYQSKPHIFMTQQRKQALYECQLLRNVKLSLGQKAYSKMQLFYGHDENNQIEHETRQRQKQQRDSQYYQKTQAQKILQKNNQRIKNQRKRVIEKLIC